MDRTVKGERMSDERIITNAEYMINLLMDLLKYEDIDFKRVDIDDGWASGEAMINYNVNCPYFSGDERAICYEDDSLIDREHCVECKQKWLLSEVDE